MGTVLGYDSTKLRSVFCSDVGPVEIPRGKIIGRRYKILKKLGEGGCGAVYKVEDIETKQLVGLDGKHERVICIFKRSI